MKRVVLMMMLAGTLSAGMCVTVTTVTSNFCAVARPLMPDTDAISDYLNDNDPRLTENLISHNTFGERNCNWNF